MRVARSRLVASALDSPMRMCAACWRWERAMTTVPTEGRPTTELDSDVLVGIDGNAFTILGTVRKALRRAGASSVYIEAYTAEATSGSYDHLIQTSMAYLEPED